MAAQPQFVSGAGQQNPAASGPIIALWFEGGRGVLKRSFDDLETAEAATDAWADEAALRGKKVRAEFYRGRKLVSRMRYLGLESNPWPFSKPKPAECVTKPSAMTLASALKSARAAGAKVGDTGLFGNWLCSAGLATRGDTLKRRLEAQFVEGVEHGEYGEIAQSKGVGIHRTAQGQFYTDLDRESLFDTMADARAFIGSWKKVNPMRREDFLAMMRRVERDWFQGASFGIGYDKAPPDTRSFMRYTASFSQAKEEAEVLAKEMDIPAYIVGLSGDRSVTMVPPPGKGRRNPSGNGHRLTATIVPQREAGGPSYRILPIIGPEGMIHVQGAFPSRAQAQRTALATVRDALRPLPGKYSLEFAHE